MSKYPFGSKPREGWQSDRRLVRAHVFFSDHSSAINVSLLLVCVYCYRTHLSFMFGSTLRRSFQASENGAPGVASNMNRPNSG